MYDVIIVGAGPGGSLAAKTSAELGLKTVFLERGKKPGNKNASGCALSPKVWRDFPKIMKLMTPEVIPSIREVRLCSHHFINKNYQEEFGINMSPSQRIHSYPEAKKWFTVNLYRAELDPWLASLAVEAGAELRTSTYAINLLKDKNNNAVGIITDKGEKIEGKVIIGADGAHSMVALKSGLRSKWRDDELTLVVSYDFKCESKERVDDVIGDNGIHCYMSGLFPAAYQFFKADGFHIGLGQWMHEWKQNPRYYLNEVLKVDTFKRIKRLTGAKPREFHVHLLPWMKYPKQTYTNNIMLIGDAAGFPCPLEAEGIYYAMLSGRIAAKVAKDAIEKGDTSKEALKTYENEWVKSPIGEEFEAGPELQEFWANTMFNQENVERITTLVNDFIGGFTTAEAHVTYMRRFFNLVQKDLPEVIPLVSRYILPLFSSVFQGPLSDFMSLQDKILPLITGMGRSKKKK
ncbi:MAG: NAD(P)/FAD-dependent oxidoreductase [Candidatus Helarchaeota archaeon]